jgi:hypothetical protein
MKISAGNSTSSNLLNDPQDPSQGMENEKLLNLSPSRLSPNLFLNLNFDNTSPLDTNPNNLKFEWSFNSNTVQAIVPETPSCIQKSPSYEFLNVDNFNIDSFKSECILNLDHNLLNHVNDGQNLLIGNSRNLLTDDKQNSIDLELHNFSLQKGELLDLEKPININISVDELQGDKF